MRSVAPILVRPGSSRIGRSVTGHDGVTRRPRAGQPLAPGAAPLYRAAMQPALPLSRDLVLIGGGHAHALVLRAWGMRPLAGARLTLIDPSPTAPYTGMLPGHVAGHYAREALEIDLVRLARFAGARLATARATGIDRDGRRVRVEGRPDIAYDVLSIDVGVTSAMPELPGFAEHAVAAKPLDAFAARWRAFLAAPSGDVVVIGGGAAGAELSMAMAHALREAGSQARVTVLEAGAALAGLAPGARGRILRVMTGLGVGLREGVRVERVGRDAAHLAGGEAIPAGLVVGAAGRAALALARRDGARRA